jgi:hypothetical protein
LDSSVLAGGTVMLMLLLSVLVVVCRRNISHGFHRVFMDRVLHPSRVMLTTHISPVDLATNDRLARERSGDRPSFVQIDHRKKIE